MVTGTPAGEGRWVQTMLQSHTSAPDHALVFQCLTSKGRELTRISLVAEGGGCVMDELVKPDNKILDYLTRYLSPRL